MKKFSLTAIGRGHLETARRASSGRSANTVYGGHEHVLRQTVIALAAGQELNEHLNPGEATVLVLSGRIRLSTVSDHWEGRGSDLLVVPPGLYAVQALQDSVVLLTVAKIDRGFTPPDRGLQDRERASTPVGTTAAGAGMPAAGGPAAGMTAVGVTSAAAAPDAESVELMQPSVSAEG